jgi:glutamine synthetase
VGVDALPPLPRDVTDRNRTSPFAFTGNKFEFRAVGSSQSCATPCTVLNVIVAEALDEISDAIEAFPAGSDFNDSLQALLRTIFRDHRRILFGGDNYSAEWREEAARRGLPCARTTPEALLAYKDSANQTLFAHFGVLTPAELDSRYEVSVAEYRRRLGIEAHVALDIARTMVAPAVEKQLGELAATCQALGGGPGADAVGQRCKELGQRLETLDSATRKLDAAIHVMDSKGASAAPALLQALAVLRDAVDHLETIADDARWPLPKYREMLSMY